MWCSVWSVIVCVMVPVSGFVAEIEDEVFSLVFVPAGGPVIKFFFYCQRPHSKTTRR